MSAMARLCSAAILLLSASSFAQATVVEDPATKEKLVGEHVFNLQWTFRVTGKRPYWRLKEMQNVCEGDNTVDYLDIYVALRRAAPQSK